MAFKGERFQAARNLLQGREGEYAITRLFKNSAAIAPGGQQGVKAER